MRPYYTSHPTKLEYIQTGATARTHFTGWKESPIWTVVKPLPKYWKREPGKR